MHTGSTNNTDRHISNAHLKQIVTGHAGLAGHTSWDDHDIAALQGSLQLCITLKALRSSTRLALSDLLQAGIGQQQRAPPYCTHSPPPLHGC
jgi:hypothetical protein